jgi:hypothetical protein
MRVRYATYPAIVEDLSVPLHTLASPVAPAPAPMTTTAVVPTAAVAEKRAASPAPDFSVLSSSPFILFPSQPDPKLTAESLRLRNPGTRECYCNKTP